MRVSLTAALLCLGVACTSGKIGAAGPGSDSGPGGGGNPPGIAVTITSGANVSVAPGASFSFTASVSGADAGQSTAVTWAVDEGASGGTIDSSGKYTAPQSEGMFHVSATAIADTSRSATALVGVSTFTVLTPDRRTVWNPGMMPAGGVPARSQVCTTVNASSYGNGTQEASGAIQSAIDGCAAGQVVQLSAGTFLTNNLVQLRKAITLRGAGAGVTILQKTNGAKLNQYNPQDAQPIIVIGPQRWTGADDATSRDLAKDGLKGAMSVTLGDASGFAAGQFVLLDELSGAGWQPDRLGRGQIWASPDYRVVWQFHNPHQSFDDPLSATMPTSGAAASWFSRPDRVTTEIKEVASVSGNVVTFTSPLHIDYRQSHKAQLTRYTGANAHLKNAGVESLTVTGGSDGAIRFESAAYCWAKAVEVTLWLGEGFAVDSSFRVEVRDSYVHDGAWSQPGGGGYAISLARGTSEVLFENNISRMANKVMVARCAGAGSVFGYNYADDGFINTIGGWIEIGLNASHMVGPHHVLFEGNEGFNWDSDHTHGNSIYHTVFRNHLVGVRSSFVNPMDGKTIDDASQSNGPKRCVGATAYSSWMSFIGNVLGQEGKMSGWTYESTGTNGMSRPAIWLLGWDDVSPQPYDSVTAGTQVRHGNFDYVTNSVHWDPSDPGRTLPDSLYLSGKPAFFNQGRGYTWPWVDPTGQTPLQTLPARARFDAGTPFTQP